MRAAFEFDRLAHTQHSLNSELQAVTNLFGVKFVYCNQMENTHTANNVDRLANTQHF